MKATEENAIGKVETNIAEPTPTLNKSAEDALRPSEELFAKAFRASPDAFIITRMSDSVLLDVNDGFSNITGYSRGEAVGKPVAELKIWGDDSDRDRMVAIVRSEGSLHNFETIYRKKSGEVGTGLISAELAQLGGELCMLTICRDVSEQREASVTLEKSLSLLRATLESTPDGILVVEGAGEITNFNQKLVELWGIPDGVMASHDNNQVLKFIASQLKDPVAFSRTAHRSYSLPDVDRFDLLELRDGRTIERYSRTLQIRGRSVGTVWSFRNVTERKQAAKALKESESKYRMLMERASDGIFLADTQGKLVDMNEMACKMLGYKLDEVLRLHVEDIAEGTKPQTTKVRAARLASNRTLYAEQVLRRKDGTLFPVEISSKFLPNGLYQGFVRDISDRKRAREELMKSKADLELRIAERTAELRKINIQLQGELVERARSQEMAKVHMARLAEAQSLAQIGSWEWTPLTNEVTWSDQLLRMFGVEATQFGMSMETYLSHIHPDDKEHVFKDIDRAVREKGSFSNESRFSHANGEMGFYHTRGEAILDEAGMMVKIRGTVQDITERKHVEEALRESEQRYRQMFQGNKSVQLLIDPTTRSIVDANPAAVQFYGYSLDELRNLRIEDLDLSISKQGEISVARLDLMESADIVLQHTLSTGEVRDVEINISPIDFSGQKLLYEIVHDITDRKLAEAKLRKSEVLHRALARNLPDGAVVLFDRDLRYQLAEGVALAAQGYSQGDLVGRTLWEVFSPATAGVLAQRYEAALAGQESTIESEYDGHFYLIHFVPVRNENGEVFAGMAVSLDITKQKRSAQEARLAQDAAEQANRAKSEFLSHMSHELRTPLNAIIGFSQLLEMDELDADRKENIQFIFKAGHHLLSLINEVLEISRIEAGEVSISSEPVAVVELIGECIDLVRPMAAARHLLVQVEIAQTTGKEGQHNPHILGDRQLIKQILLNLLSNAIKYNLAEGSVLLSYQEMDSGLARIAVRDTGQGIPPNKIGKLFTPFERLGADQTHVEGSGLGLALSKRLAELQGGTIGLESVIGQGCTFWLELPVAAEPLEQMVLQAAEPLGLPQESWGNRTLLYIEDNFSNLRLIEHILMRQSSIKLISAVQGRLGFELAIQHRPDLILLDLHLPDVHGEKVLEWLKGDPRSRGIPVIILSADATPRQIDRLLSLGADAYITKPINVRRFLRTVEENFVGRQIINES